MVAKGIFKSSLGKKKHKLAFSWRVFQSSIEIKEKMTDFKSWRWKYKPG